MPTVARKGGSSGHVQSRESCAARRYTLQRLSQRQRDSTMPTIKNGDATIYYEEHGKGFPILTFAPAGLQSTIQVWSGSSAPINPVSEWSSQYRVIVMDQRNAAGGGPFGPGKGGGGRGRLPAR